MILLKFFQFHRKKKELYNNLDYRFIKNYLQNGHTVLRIKKSTFIRYQLTIHIGHNTD